MRAALALALVVLMVLAWTPGLDDLTARLASVHSGWVATAVAALLAQTVLLALRWRLTARYLGLEFTAGWALKEYLVGQIVNVTVPGGVVGDGVRAARSRSGDGGLKRAAQAVVLERAAGQLGLLCVGVSGLLWAVVFPQALDLPPNLVRGLAIAALITGIILSGALVALRGGRIAALVARCLPTAGVRLVHAALSVGAALLNVAAFAAAARAIGVTLSAADALLLVPVILTAMLIPVGLAGWGWREGAAAALFPVAGADAADGVAAGIVFGIAMMIAAAPGIPFLLWGTESGVRTTRTDPPGGPR